MHIGSVEIEPNIMNAACDMAKTPADVHALARTGIGAIVIGSITLAPRDGNAFPRWQPSEEVSWNRFGLPNKGIGYYDRTLPTMVETGRRYGKKVILSIAGEEGGEYAALTTMAQSRGVDVIEVNLGCPNASGHLHSFSLNAIDSILQSVSRVSRVPLSVKVAPYSDPKQLKDTAQLIASYDEVGAVVSANAFPTGQVEGGGLSGKWMRGFMPYQIAQWREALPESVSVIGVGGIESRVDVQTYIEAGAAGVQAATLIMGGYCHEEMDRLI